MTVRRELTAVVVAVVTGGVLLLFAEPALGLVSLAGAGAAAMLQPRPRTAVAAVVLLVGVGVAWLAWTREDVLLASGGLLVGLAAAVALARSGRWPPPARGRTPEREREQTGRDTWEALDRGEDPTV